MTRLKVFNLIVMFQTYKSPEDMLEKRLRVLKEILNSEESYLSELETLLTVTHTN